MQANQVHSVRDLFAIIEMVAARLRTPLYIQGFPGVAKSSAAAQFAAENEFAFLPYRFGYASASEVGGIAVPDFKAGVVRRFVPDLIASVRELRERAGTPVVLLLDEMDKCGKVLQNVALELLLERAIAGHALPEDTILLLAGNVGRDGSGANALSTALGNRVTIADFTGPEPGEWIMHVDPCVEVAQLVRSDPSVLKPGVGEGFHADQAINTTPRSLESASDKMLLSGVSETVLETLLNGTVYGPHAAKLMTLRQLSSELYSFDDVVEGKAKKFTGPDRTALSTMQCRGLARSLAARLAKGCEKKEADNAIVGVIEYVSRVVPAEINASALQDVASTMSRATNDTASARILSAYKALKKDSGAFEKLRDRSIRAMGGA